LRSAENDLIPTASAFWADNGSILTGFSDRLHEEGVYMTKTVTRDMLAKALQRLELLQANETLELESEQSRQRAEEVAEVALQAIAVCVKYMLASGCQSALEGLGTFYFQDGHIGFTPESDVLQYALLKQQDEVSMQQAVSDAFVQNLSVARSLLPMIQVTQNLKTSGLPELAPEDRLLEAIFEHALPNRFDVVVSTLLSLIIRDLQLAGIKIKLAREVSVVLEEEGRSAAPPPATAEVGKTYLGKVVRIAEFGAFVELFPGTDGLLHISEIAAHRVRDVRDELKLGDSVLVKVIAVEGNRVRLSRKALIKEARARNEGTAAAVTGESPYEKKKDD
jgi:predicted RNA-binding protein with RPS1 domain